MVNLSLTAVVNPAQMQQDNESDHFRVKKNMPKVGGSQGIIATSGGRPQFPAGLMFKVLALQARYSFSGHQAEFVIQDCTGRQDDLAISRKPGRTGAMDNATARYRLSIVTAHLPTTTSL